MTEIKINEIGLKVVAEGVEEKENR